MKTGSRNPFPFTGLSSREALRSATRFGRGGKGVRPTSAFWNSFRKSFLDPIFLLLILAAVLYLLLDKPGEALVMGIAMVLVASISFYQEQRSAAALKALQQLTAQKARVIRNDRLFWMECRELVLGDYVVAEEGTIVAADGTICYAHDFAVNESLLTGEAASIYKSAESADRKVYEGTAVVSGQAVYVVEQLGADTRFGQIGHLVTDTKREPSPLEKQIHRFVGWMSLAGAVVFLLVWGIHFYHSGVWISSLLAALTLAMSILPEEIPVAFTTFMALGARRLMQKGILAKDVRTVEALGAATVICLDKTGTITANRMQLQQVFTLKNGQVYDRPAWQAAPALELITLSMWASEATPFDQMEKELHRAYTELQANDMRPDFHMEKEYPLAGDPPMMTHVFSDRNGTRIIAAKGAPEKLIGLCQLTKPAKRRIDEALSAMTRQGYRVLAVAQGHWPEVLMPAHQEVIPFALKGLIAFYDPPKPGIATVLDKFYRAGIQVKILTGDHQHTTRTIAAAAGMRGVDPAIDGEGIKSLTDTELVALLSRVNVFTRMFPETKLRVINTLKKMGHIVAMTGDGVNDAPALKAAHIGIAMGKRGSETARQTASLILLDDDLDKMTEAIAMGRQIYLNLNKAIRYIISIHIPIILVVTMPLLLQWRYPDLFLPIHVVFLELIMGPTCSIVYENEPPDKDAMSLPPRLVTADLLTWRELSSSIWQGLVIALAALLVYRSGAWWQLNEQQVRSLVFITLISSNVALTLAGRSFAQFSIITAFGRNWLMSIMIAATLLCTISIFTLPAVRQLFALQLPPALAAGWAIMAGLLAAGWQVLPKKRESLSAVRSVIF